MNGANFVTFFFEFVFLVFYSSFPYLEENPPLFGSCLKLNISLVPYLPHEYY